MRKLFITALMAATILPATGAIAQSRAEVQRSQQELQRQKEQLRDAQRYGDRRDIQRERHDVREARREVREDWRDYRRSNGNVFRQGRYTPPRGHQYRPIRQGASLNRAFYGQRYWIADPYRYRLPRVNGNQRWVRYGNDVLLVNIRNGRILQVYNGFFW